MNWITKIEVESAAIDSGRAAIECSIAHWRQLLTATKREVRAHEHWRVLALGTYCALCERYRGADGGECEKCPVGKIKPCEKGLIWPNASLAFDRWMDGKISRRQFRKKAQPMLDLLDSLLETN